MKQRIIYVCSPLRGDIEQNLKNARIYCRNIAKEYPDTIPLAPHLYCTQFLDDNHADERELGIAYTLRNHPVYTLIYKLYIHEKAYGYVFQRIPERKHL